MANSLTVKAFLQREGAPPEEPEIRRFQVEGRDLYRALRDKIVSVFPALKPDSFTLHWKDGDEDLVQFSSQEELHYAANQIADGILRLYVFARDGEEVDDVVCMDHGADDGATQNVTFDMPPRAPDSPLHPMMVRHWGGPWMGQGMHWARMGRFMRMKKKWIKKMMKEDKRKDKEFQALVRQVPAPFRCWVRIYIRTWFLTGFGNSLVMAPEREEGPEDAPPNFRQWLSNFLTRCKEKWIAGASKGIDVEEMEVWEMCEENEEEKERGDLLPPEGLPLAHYQWISHYVLRFLKNHAPSSPGGSNAEGELATCHEDHGFHGHGHWKHGHGHYKHGHGHWKHGHGHGHWKHGYHHGKKNKHGYHSSSSDSEDNGSQYAQFWKKIPKEFRMYVRKLVKQLHKDKGGKSDIGTEKLVPPLGMTSEVNQFLQQFVQDWHAKLAEKRPRAVSMEMAEEEMTLPEGLNREHFLWLCHFMARWHRQHAGKCDIMGNWSSGDTSNDTSDEGKDDAEDTADCHMYGTFGGWPHHHGSKHHFHAAMMGLHSHPCKPVHQFYHPPPPPPPYIPMPFMGHHLPGPHMHPHPGMGPFGMGCPAMEMMAPPVRIGCPGRRGFPAKSCQDHGAEAKRHKNQAGAASNPHDAMNSDMVEHVTEGVRKM